MKKMTPEQEKKWNKIEEKIASWWWGLVAAAIIVASIVYGPWTP